MKIFVFFICIFIQQVVAIERNVLEVIYPPRESKEDTRDDDIIELLNMILEATVYEFGPYTMKPLPYFMNEARFTILLKKEISLNVIWRSVTPEYEEELLPIRVPIRSGILGYRIFLINKEDQKIFNKIENVDQLKKLVVGQGHTWNDVKIFEENNFKIATGTTYEGLFNMLSKKRFDYFSRGINEAYKEMEERQRIYPELHVEETILLYYPWPKYFYVAKGNYKLAKRIERGFEIIKSNQSYEKWFWKYNGKDIFRADFKSRKLFKIDNPLLPKSVPINDEQLWFNPF
ncbi:substrate-binding periplasmic protein [Spartinivicinus ruber]|uniref:substrate-binding periplasmic protein n=1 Tax=Spartinivicinus ruber TaxID=2683272 RepID=UPI0013D3BBB5|nr:transporter substrate-binding domain-containing protein [Spartinivicinus ruber]